MQEYFQEVQKNWKIVGVVIAFFCTFFLIKAIFKEPTYTAKLTFMINEDEGNSLGGVASILGQFGLGGGGGRSKFNLEKILQLSKSRRIIQEALFEKVTIEGQEDYFANHLIKTYHFHEKWKKDTSGLKDFTFRDDEFAAFDKNENRVLKMLYGQVVGNSKNKVEGLLSTSYGEDTGIMSMHIKSISEALSLNLVEAIYEKLSRFYIDKSTEKQEQTYRIIKAKADSIQHLLDRTQIQFLKFLDTNKGLTLQRYNAQKLKLQRDLQVFAVAYGEALKNVEIADFALKTATPFFQVLDEPIAPIRPAGSSKFKAILMGGLLGGFLGVGFVVGRKIIREAMAE